MMTPTQWIFIQAAVVLVGAFTLGFSVKKILKFLHLRYSDKMGLSTFSEALYLPAKWFIWFYGLLTAWRLINDSFEWHLKGIYFPLIYRILVILCAAWFIFRWKKRYEERFFRKQEELHQYDRSLTEAVSRLSSIFIFAVILLTILQVLEIPIAGLLTFGGIGGLAITWAAKDVVANFFGGLMLYIHRTVTVGDWIQSPNKGFEGTVEEIGWYHTRLQTMDQGPMYIPNALFTDAIIINPKQKLHQRILFTLGLSYTDLEKLPNLIKDLEKKLNAADIPPGCQVTVRFADYTKDALNVEVRVLCPARVPKDPLLLKQIVLLECEKVLKKHEVDFAIPVSAVYLYPDSGIVKS